MSQHVISIQEIIVIALTMAKRTDFVERPAPVVVPTPRVAIQTTQNMQQMRTSGTLDQNPWCQDQ